MRLDKPEAGMKIALIQMNSVSDKAANLAAAEALITRVVAEEKPDWIALPEVWDFIGGDRNAKWAAGEEIGAGPASCLMADLAARHGVFIHAGSLLERVADEPRLYNTTVAYDRAGREVARYRKIHMFDIVAPDGTEYRESAAFKPGAGLAAYACEGFTVGCAICYDLRFPALFQALVDRGADLIALPSAFTLQTGKDHWEVLCRARAIETQTYFCAPAQTGAHTVGKPPREDTRHTYGHSLVVDPWGHVVARASDGAGYVAARVAPARVAAARGMIPVARHRQPIG